MLPSNIHGGRPTSLISSTAQLDIKIGLELFLAQIDRICLGEPKPKLDDISYVKKNLTLFKNHFGNLNFLAEHYYKNLKEKYEFSSKTYDFNRLTFLFPNLTGAHKSIDVSFYKRLKELHQQDKANPLKSRYIEKFYSQGEDSQNDFFKQFFKGEKTTEFSSLLKSQSSVATSKTTITDSLYSFSSSPFSFSVTDQSSERDIDEVCRQSTQLFKQIDQTKQSQTANSNNELFNILKINLQFLLSILIEQNKPEFVTNWTIKKLLIRKLEKELTENPDPEKNDYLLALKKQFSSKSYEESVKKSTSTSTITPSNLSLLTRLARIERGSKSSRDLDKIVLTCEKINKYLIEQRTHEASERESENESTIQGTRKEKIRGNTIRKISSLALSRSSERSKFMSNGFSSV